MEHLIATLTRYAKSLTKYTPHIDHRDLVNDTIVKLLEGNKEITEGFAIAICKNSFRYILARNRTIHKNYKDVRLLLYPEIEESEAEVSLLCKEEHHELYNWPKRVFFTHQFANKKEYLKDYRIRKKNENIRVAM